MARARRAALAALTALAAFAALAHAAPRYSSRIVDTESGAIRGVIVEPASRRLEPVEVFRGVPYAARPQRLSAPPAPPTWSGTRLADAFAPVCPQRYPDISNRTAALSMMPVGRFNELKLIVPLLANQSEDCLYLNIYVPGSGARGVEAPYGVLAWLGGGSFEWGTANVLDGSVLAARAHLIVVTINYRLGLLGFLTSSDAAPPPAAQDAAMALSWVRRNIASFGGDPRRVALAGHDSAAALATVLLAMPECKGLFSRALLMSGTSLSSWATAPDGNLLREATAQQLHCQTVNSTDDPPSRISVESLFSCVRSRPLAVLTSVRPPRARFLPAWGPLAAASSPRALDASDAFVTCSLAIGLATTESYDEFSDTDVQYGFEEDYRNRVLRTYVRNVYTYHRNEIFAAIRNEYTDWDKPIQHPINIRDATLEALSDGATAAPALRVAHLHARRGASTHLFHFAYQTKESDYPQRLGSVRGEALPYLFGAPLVAGLPLAPHNYTRQDVAVAETVLALVAAFVKTGDPSAGAGVGATNGDPPTYPDYERAHYGGPAWPRYEPATQFYLYIGSKPRIRSHYRGHKMALWLHLVPQLHRPGAAAPRHHNFRERENHFYSGAILPERYMSVTAFSEEGAGDGEEDAGGSDGEGEVEGEECEPPLASRPAQLDVSLPPAHHPPAQEADLLKTLTDTHYYSYSLALGVTVGVGCFLLALNVLIFAGIYYQRGRAARRARQARKLARHPTEDVQMKLRGRGEDEASPGPSLGLRSTPGPLPGSQSSPASNLRKSIRQKSHTLPRQRSETNEAVIEHGPEAHESGAGTLTMPVKKRVQIQEISV